MSAFLNVALAAARDAEEVIRQHFDPAGTESKSKTDGSPITVADTEAEMAIIRRIKRSFPEHSILGEETGKEEKQSEYTWIIDPIDGTKNFIRGLPFFGTLIALMKDGEIIVGVSNIPLLNDLMHAEKGKGAFANGVPTHVSTVQKFSNAYISSGGTQSFAAMELGNKLMEIRNHVFQYRIFGDSYMYHLLAQGRIDAVIEGHIKIYDVAALKLIVEEAGGRATEMNGNEMSMEATNFLATNSYLHDDLIKYFSLSP